MAKYREQTVTANEYTRSSRVVITNEKDSPPKIEFYEERVRQAPGMPANIRNLPGVLSETLTPGNATEEFSVLDMNSLLPTGKTATYKDLGDILTSLYYHVAQKRDAKRG